VNSSFARRLDVRWIFVAALLALACSGGGQPAQEPDAPPPFDDPAPSSEPVAPASSPKVQQGIDAIQAGDHKQAKALLEQAAQENPNDPQAAFYLGVANEGTGDAAGALAQYKKALGLDPKLTEARVNLSALQLDAEDAAGALETVEAGLKQTPKHPELLTNRALALEALGKNDEALSAYAAAVEAKADDPMLRYAYAELLAGANKSSEAVAQLKQLGMPSDPKLLAAVATLFGKLQAYADCVAVLDKAIKDAATADAYTRRGVCRHGMKDDAGAKQDYEAAIAADAKFAPAHFYLGQHLKTSDKKRACAELAKAAELAGGAGVGQAAKKERAELKCK
jgi:Tfp pilus assembly protein PilF